MASDETAGVIMWKPPIVSLQDSTCLTEAVSILSLGSAMKGQQCVSYHKNNQKRNQVLFIYFAHVLFLNHLECSLWQKINKPLPQISFRVKHTLWPHCRLGVRIFPQYKPRHQEFISCSCPSKRLSQPQGQQTSTHTHTHTTQKNMHTHICKAQGTQWWLLISVPE